MNGCIWCGETGRLETYTEAGSVDESTVCVCVLREALLQKGSEMSDFEDIRERLASDIWPTLPQCREMVAQIATLRSILTEFCDFIIDESYDPVLIRRAFAAMGAAEKWGD